MKKRKGEREGDREREDTKTNKKRGTKKNLCKFESWAFTERTFCTNFYMNIYVLMSNIYICIYGPNCMCVHTPTPAPRTVYSTHLCH